MSIRKSNMFLRQISIKNICAALIVFVALFLYIFNILPLIGPERIGTREYLSVLASVFVLIILPKLPRVYFGLVIANWTQTLFSIITVILNGTTDLWYLQFAIRNILYINGAILIAYLMPKRWSLDSLVLLIIAAIIINDIISFLGFINPNIASTILSIQDFSKMEKVERIYGFGNRIIGIGRNNFFNGGVTNGMGIILAFYLISKKKLPLYLGLLLISIMTIVGLFIARTTIVGVVLGGCLYLASLKRKTKVIYGLIISAIIAYIIYLSGLLENLDTSRAFEVFEHYDELNEVESLNSLNKMYDRDMSFATLLFGNGLSKEGDFYYMHTDAGYMRNIFYFGVIGTIFGYFYYEYYILRKLYDFSKKMKMLVLTLAVYLLVLNLKGLPDYNFLIFLLLAFFIRKKIRNGEIQLKKGWGNDTQTKLVN